MRSATPPGFLDSIDLLRLVNAAIKKAGSQAAFAEQCGISKQHLNRAVNRHIEYPDAVLKALEINKIVYFVPKQGGTL